MIRHLIALVLFLVPASVSAAGLIDATPRIALMSAFEPEWRVLVDDVEEARTHRLNGVEFVTGRLADRDVVLFLSGISMVNAAMTTQLAVDRFNVRRIVFSGIAGGLDPDLDIGDVVVSARWGQYFDLFLARETEGGFQVPPWMKSEFPNYGMMFTRNIEVASAGKDRPEEKFWFASDPRMLSAAEKVARNLVLPACSPDGDCLGRPPRIRVGGNGVSGSAFVDNAAFRAFVFEAFEARVVDMESAAVAHVAYANGLPFIAIRSLSDLAGGGENENELPVFFKLAAANSARVVRAFLAALD